MPKSRVPTGKDLNGLIHSLCFGEEDIKFWEGLDGDALESRFTNTAEAAFECIKPLWDLRPESLRFNPVAPQALIGARLYFAERNAFLRHCANAEIYCHDVYQTESNKRQFLKIIGQWLRGNTLTPPLFFVNSDKQLEKVDGHHRTTVAFMAKTPIFPFYCQDTIEIAGIVRASAQHCEQDGWTP